MTVTPINGFENPYKLLRRFETLIESILTLNATIRELGFVRFKPIFASYISCVEGFKSSYAEEYKNLGLEKITLYDEQGTERFTARRLSTILSQAQAVLGVLRGLLPPELLGGTRGTNILISLQAAAQSSAGATAQLQYTLTLEGLDQAIQESKLDQRAKDELKKEIEELKNLPAPSESKIKALAGKLGRKLQEVSENVAVGVITNLLKNQMGPQ